MSFFLLGWRPDNSTLILRIHDEHLLRLQGQHIAHLEIVWLSFHRVTRWRFRTMLLLSFPAQDIAQSRQHADALWAACGRLLDWRDSQI